MLPYFGMEIMGDTNCNLLLKVFPHIKEGNHFLWSVNFSYRENLN